MPNFPGHTAYIVAARRTAIGRVGGLHRARRIEDLTAPVIVAALEDCRLSPEQVDEIVIGSATQGGNPARLIALAAGLPDTVPAASIDRQCGSGLDAILAAARSICLGEANVIVAGGADSLSTAPWRIAKPRNLYQLPHFLRLEPGADENSEESTSLEGGEALSRRFSIGRERQDAWVVRSHLKAETARAARRFVGEIVPLRANPDEARDQSAGDPSSSDLEDLPPFLPPDGTLTVGNTTLPHDGAAIVIVVSEAVWVSLGKPPALRLLASAVHGVPPEQEAGAPMAAMRKLYARLNGFDQGGIGLIELNETSAAQAIAFANELEIDDAIVNPDGGATVRGHPLGAASAVLVVRLFTRMVRAKAAERPGYGVAALGTIGGLGMAALFEAV